MKKQLITITSLTVASALLLSACGVSNNPTSSTQSSGGDKAAAPMKLRILTANAGGKTPEENAAFEKEIKRLTGIDVTLERPASGYDQKVATVISSGDKYDLIEGSDLGKLANYIKQGVASDLTDFVKQSKVLSDPKVIPTGEWDQLKGTDGKTYAVFAKYQGGTMPIIRQDWLTKLNLQQPKTLDDYYNVMKAFKEKDPDGNGKADTYGISTSGLYDMQGFFTAAGVQYKYVMKDGKRTIPFATDAAIPVYDWFAKLYKEGLLDPNFVTNDSGKMRDMFLTDRVGIVTYWDAWVGMFNNMRKQKDPNTTFEAKGLPGIVGPDGNYSIRRGDPDFFIIPANAENKQAAQKFLEFWNTKEGITLGSLGIQGEDYTLDSNGKYKLTDLGTQHNMDHGVPFWYNTTFEAPFPKLPGVQEAQDLSNKYGKIQTSLPEWTDAQKIVDGYAIKAITGQMTSKEAVEKMHNELLASKLIDE